jgi:hypothetical protein
MTNVSTSPDLYIEFSTDPWASRNFSYTYEAINSEHRISHGMADPLLESLQIVTGTCVTIQKLNSKELLQNDKFS